MTFHKGLLLLVGLIMTFATGCRQGSIQIERERGSNVFNITVNLNESEVETIVAEVLGETTIPLSNTEVDLQPGQIVASGDYETENGSIVNGRITLVPSVQDGALMVQTTSVEIEGVDISDERIERMNERMAERFSRRADRQGRAITMENVTVTDDDMDLVYSAERQE